MKKLLPFLLVFSTTPALLAQLAQVPQKINYQGRIVVGGVNFNGTGQFKFAFVDALNVNQTAHAFTMAGGSVISVFVNRPGTGYSDPPVVTFAAPETPGITATATATVENGHVTGITLTQSGSGYTTQPAVTIAPPPSNLIIKSLWSNDLSSIDGSEPTTSVTLPVNQGLYSVVLGDPLLANMNEVGPSVFLNPGEIPNDPQFYPAPKDIRLRVWFDDGVHGFQQLTPDQPLSSAPFAFLASNVSDAAITSNKIAEGAIGTSKLTEGAVLSSKVGAGAITPEKLFATTSPLPGQFPRFNGTQFEWVSQALSLPFSGSLNSANPVLSITNTGLSGTAIAGVSSINGFGDPGGIGVSGRVRSFTGGAGVQGISEGVGNGVEGVAVAGNGVTGETTGQGQSGVIGYATAADSTGVHGTSALHHGVYAYTGSTNRAAIWAFAPNGAEAVHGQSNGADGLVGVTNAENAAMAGVYGSSLARGAYGVYGYSAQDVGVFAVTDNRDIPAVLARNTTPNGEGLRVEGNAKITGTLTTGALSSKGLGVTELATFNGRVNSLTETYLYNLARVQGDLEVTEQAYKHGDYTWDVPSDRRLKNEAGSYEIGLAEIERIRTIRFSYKEGNPFDFDPKRPQIGVIAQELKEIIPDAVTEGKDGYLAVKVDPVIWAMVNSIKELKSENTTLRAQLETENHELKQRLDKLEQQSTTLSTTP